MGTRGQDGDGARFEDRVAGVAALHEPLRRRLYDLVAAADHPVGRDEAAAAAGIARSVAAFHLDKLADAGLLDVEFRRMTGRTGPGAGRPAKLYRRSSRELAVTVPERRYDLAAHLLARAVSRSAGDGTPAEVALAAAAGEVGAAMGGDAVRRAGPRPGRARLRAAVTDVLADHGYEPRQEGGRIVLGNCPFHDLAAEHPDLVCGMNLDLVAGLAGAAPGSRLQARLEPRSPRCCVVLEEG